MAQEGRIETLPDKITVDYYDDYMHIQKKWFGAGAIILTVFMAIWLSAIVFIYRLLGANFSDMPLNVGLLLPIGFTMMTGFMIYACVAMWLNKTDIFVAKDRLEIKIGPIWWRGNMKRKTGHIVQFFVKEIITKNKNSTKISYNVMFKEQDGGVRKLVVGLEKYEQAHYIEQKIEDYLGIKNVKVDGEALD